MSLALRLCFAVDHVEGVILGKLGRRRGTGWASRCLRSASLSRGRRVGKSTAPPGSGTLIAHSRRLAPRGSANDWETPASPPYGAPAAQMRMIAPETVPGRSSAPRIWNLRYPQFRLKPLLLRLLDHLPVCPSLAQRRSQEHSVVFLPFPEVTKLTV